MARIAELADIVTAADSGFASGDNIADGVVQVRMHNVTSDGTLDWSTLRRVPANQARLAKYALEPGDVLFNSTNSPDLVGKSALFKRRHEPVVFSNHFLRLRLDRETADPPFIAWWLHYQWRRHRFEKLATRWVNQAAIRKVDLLGLSIALPPLPDQRRIAAILGFADHARRTRRYALTLSDRVLPSTFTQMFGQHDEFPHWEVLELAEERPNAIRTGPFGSQLLHSEFTDHGVAVLGIDNAVNNRFEWARRRFITKQKFEQLKRYQVRPGDVLITIMGTCGRCAVVPDDIGTAINTKHLCCISLDQTRCLPSYLQGAFLYHPRVRRQLEAATNGAIMDGLNMEIIKSLRMPLPPVAEQEKYVSVAVDHARLRRMLRESLRQTNVLFDSLLRRAFGSHS